MAKERYQYLDVIKLLATFCVIAIHTIPSFMHTDSIGLNIFYDTLMSMLHSAVVLFMMVTGGLMLTNDREYTFFDIYKGHIKKTLVCLLSFGTVFSMMEIFIDEGKIDVFNAFLNVLMGKSWDHLWYLYMLLGFYILVPVIKPFLKTATKNQVLFFMGLLFVFNCIIPIYTEVTGIKTGFYLPVTKPTFVYFILGFYMMKFYESDGKIRYNIFALIFAAAIMLVFVMDKQYNHNATAEILLSSNLTSPVIAVISYNIFAIFKKKESKITLPELLKPLIPITFGIYLIHPVFIHIFNMIVKVDSLILSLPPVCAVLVIMIFILSAISIKILNFITAFAGEKLVKRKYIIFR